MFYFITLILLSGTSSITANLELQCQQGWHKYDDNCYWLSDFKATRDNAKLECGSRESKLVTIDKQTINTFLKQHITRNTSYWIGLRMENIAISSWRWNTGGKLRSTYTTLYWCDNIIDPFTACAVMNYNPDPCLKSYACHVNLPFICEKEVPAAAPLCPLNWKLKSDNTPRCYYINEGKMTRMEAARYCWNIGGRLVTVPNYIIKVYLTETRPSSDNTHWVGLSPYKWDDGTPYNWDNWDNNGPHIAYQCTRLLPGGMWTYGNCSTELYSFICKKEAIQLVSTTGRSTVGIKTTTFTKYFLNSSHSTTSVSQYQTTTSRMQATSTAFRPFESLFTTTGVLVKEFTSQINSTDIEEVKIRDTIEEATKKYLITIGIMSVVTTCSLGAVVGLVVYIKRRMVPKQQNPTSQGIQYEDVSAAYYNVGVAIEISRAVKKNENKDPNCEDKEHNGTYEELSTRQDNASVQNGESGPYATLK